MAEKRGLGETYVPNPSQGSFRIVLPFEPEDGGTIRVVNQLGQEVANITVDQRIMDINLDYLHNGVYWLGIKGRNKEESLSNTFMIRK